MIDQNYDVNKTRYTHRDYESIKSDLIGAIPSLTQEWTTREESDPGIVLIKLISMFGDTLSYNVDKIALELYIQTVTQRKNCAKILRLLGYKMHWYRSAKVVAHVRLVASQDIYSNVNHAILKPYVTQFTAGQVKYTVVGLNHSTNEIDIFSDQDTTAVYLVQGTPLTEKFTKTSLINNRYYFGSTDLDESEIILEVTDTTKSSVTCTLTDSLYLVSSSRQIYFEFNVDEYDRPYIELADNWADVAGTDACTFTVTFLNSSGSRGNISANSFSNASNIEYSSDINFNNLVINNLDNTKEVDDDGNIDSYNSRGYDPQTVEEARRDSANYVFTHDTLVTSSDFEKACRRVDGITVSKLVDSQVVINDSLNLNEICTRAEDRFDKVFVEEYSETEPDVLTVNEYLLQYLVIMYLVYQNFNPETNDYVQSLGASSLYSLADQKYSSDPYDVEYWEPTIERVSTGSPDDVYELEGPISDPSKGFRIGIEIYIDRRPYRDFNYETHQVNDKVQGLVEISDSGYIALDESQIYSISAYTGDTLITIDHYKYTKVDNHTCQILIEDNAPSEINRIVINNENIDTNNYEYNSVEDTVKFRDFVPEAGSVIEIKKRYFSKVSTISLSDAPSAVASLVINGEVIQNYDYSVSLSADGQRVGTITLRNRYFDKIEDIQYLIINNKLVKEGYTFSNLSEMLLKSPGYYPYKMTSPYLNNVRQYLDTLKVLNVQVEFGTVKVFPFKVVGTLHLVNNYSPQEVLQIVKTVNNALEQAYYPDLHDIGERPDFLELVDIIQGADERIKYFDATGNIVEWAPEVKKRLNDFEEIFDTTSAIMYNGLSEDFILAKRFFRFRFRNYATLPDDEEAVVSEILGTEEGKGYDLPDDYGTAYLINYCNVANKSPVIKISPNSYITLDIKNLKELQALCEDLSFRGVTMMTYIREIKSEVSDSSLGQKVDERTEVFAQTTYNDGPVDGYNTKFTSSTLEIIDGKVIGEYKLNYTGSVGSNGVLDYEETITDVCEFTAGLTYTFTGDGSNQNYQVNNNSSIISCTVDGVSLDKDQYKYLRKSGDLQFNEAPSDQSTIVIKTALSKGSTLELIRTFYVYDCLLSENSLLKELDITKSGKFYSIEFATSPQEAYKVFETASKFDSPDSKLINSSDNSQVLDLINEHSDDGLSFKVKLYEPSELVNNKLYIDMTTEFYEDTPYTSESQTITDDELTYKSYIDKMVLINNTGMRWIEGN